MKKEEKTETIIGYVDETEDDDIVGLIISTEEEDFVVDMNKHGRRLLQELGSEVEATGVVKRSKDGKKTISITSFEILDEEDDEEDEEEIYADQYRNDDDFENDDFYRDDRDDWNEDEY
jgi:vacuolar-type H+-ATPase subunit E/Vma4